MAYTIHKSDGTVVTIADNAIDTDYYDSAGGTLSLGQGIQLVGRNAIDYGSAIAQNFLQTTENFASSTGTQPVGDVVLEGQLWYDNTLKTLYVRITPPVHLADNMANWAQIGTIADSGAVTGTDGQIKVNGGVISIWANGAWQQVFPAIYS